MFTQLFVAAALVVTVQAAQPKTLPKGPQPKAPAVKGPAPKAAPPAAPAQPGTITMQESCSVVVSGANGTTTQTPFPALKLLGLPANAGLPGLPVGGGGAIRCDRSAFGMGDQDWRVIMEYQMPLIIVGGDLAAILELVEGKFSLRMLRGALSAEDAAAFAKALDAAAVASNARTSPASPPAAQRPR